MTVPDNRIRLAYRVRVLLFLLIGALVILALFLLDQGIYTLRVLDVVERERDRWQRPGEVMEALNLKDGSVVADIGAGAGYFTLKLAPIVGEKGRVFAEDILREPLVFLWIRALLRHQRNVHVIHGQPEDPYLTAGQMDAVLVANTYHEFVRPQAVLEAAFNALRHGGRLVILDRGPLPEDAPSPEFELQHHELAPAKVETQVREAGFELIRRDDRFIDLPALERAGDRPDDHSWWLILAYKP